MQATASLPHTDLNGQTDTQQTIKFYVRGRHKATWVSCRECGEIYDLGEPHECQPIIQLPLPDTSWYSCIPFMGEPCYVGDPDADDYGLEAIA